MPTVCSKTAAGDELVVGVDFVEPDDPTQHANLTRFRSILSEHGFETGTSDKGGEE